MTCINRFFFDVDLRHHLERNPNLAAQIMMGYAS
ncbi:hypothetical protein HDEF_2305 [Candidatus Hamiltonella defensa 5AT (Acyrthosiphon pisum)]|uniref:Uncharacterized protein n=1 Tax=Hamiltonella defensa subsp. Acyrthosiphon pisum (strain 5AT) TaxID=572265 RepID=C4K8X4_HAMD5|nr:hypothetical protein HDEF_2305 [Candidatus Hamiltonella defensa 5AT (Acyrthosiphon pisum)]